MARKKLKEIDVYDKNDTSLFIDKNKPMRLKDLNIELQKGKGIGHKGTEARRNTKEKQ